MPSDANTTVPGTTGLVDIVSVAFLDGAEVGTALTSQSIQVTPSDRSNMLIGCDRRDYTSSIDKRFDMDLLPSADGGTYGGNLTEAKFNVLDENLLTIKAVNGTAKTKITVNKITFLQKILSSCSFFILFTIC